MGEGVDHVPAFTIGQVRYCLQGVKDCWTCGVHQSESGTYVWGVGAALRVFLGERLGGVALLDAGLATGTVPDEHHLDVLAHLAVPYSLRCAFTLRKEQDPLRAVIGALTRLSFYAKWQIRASRSSSSAGGG